MRTLVQGRRRQFGFKGDLPLELTFDQIPAARRITSIWRSTIRAGHFSLMKLRVPGGGYGRIVLAVVTGAISPLLVVMMVEWLRKPRL